MSVLRVAFCALVLVTISISSTAAEEIYRWRDAQGTIHFADAPPPYPAKVSRLDGASDRTVARKPQASLVAPRLSPATANPSISSLINVGPRSQVRRSRTDASPGNPRERTSETSGSGPLFRNAVVRRLDKAANAPDTGARRDETANDLAVPSLDHALADPVSAGDDSERATARNGRSPSRRKGLLLEAETP